MFRRVSALLPVVLAGCPSPPGEPAWESSVDLSDGAGAILGIWGTSRDDVWAAGGNQETMSAPGAGAVFHFDGDDWTSESLPADIDMLNWVFGVDGEVWVCGNGGTTARYVDGNWSMVDTPTDFPLWGLWGTAADNLWTVGGDPFGDTPVLLHWDGDSWGDVTLPMLDREVPALFKVWGAAEDDAWAIGQRGLVLHFDGGEWTQVDAGTTSDLISLFGVGADDILVVGGRSNATMLRWDGGAWTVEENPLPGLNGVWMGEDGDAIVAGNLGAYANIPAQSFEFTEEDVDVGPVVLHGIYGFDDGARFVGGGNLLNPAPWNGVLMQYLP